MRMKVLLLSTVVALAAAGCGNPGTGNEAAPVAENQTADVNTATPTTAGGVAPASFKCDALTEPAEKLICGDAQLARMDQEMWRVYQIAIKDPQGTPTDDALAMKQDEWITARNQCGADADPKSCIAWDYAERIHQLRQGSSKARVDDPKGISEGPVAYRCKGLDALIGATFVNADPSVVYLEWLDQSVALTQGPSGSGAKYTATGDDGEYSFWTKGDEAMFQRPGGPEMSCAEEVIG